MQSRFGQLCKEKTYFGLLNHILSNLTIEQLSGVVNISITDHYPVFTLIESSTRKYPTKQKQSFDKKKFVASISNSDWSPVLSETDPCIAFEKFNSIIQRASQQSSSTIKVTRWFSTPRNPWITRGLLRSITKRHNLYKKTKLQPFNLNLKLRYNNYSNTLSTLLKNSKRKYFEEEIMRRKNDSRKTWELIKSFLNQPSTRHTISKINTTSRTLMEPKEIANEFNEFFTGNEIANGSDASPTYSVQSSQSFYLYPTNPPEISSTISNLKSTGPGLDGVLPSSIKIIGSHVSVPLCHIINYMFKEGTFPDQLKVGKITPVLKKGDAEVVPNYRPICILPFFSKIVEKLIVTRLTKYFDKFNLLSPHQFGFRPGFSTEHALISFTDTIKRAIDMGHIVGAIFVDFTKAFDTINHTILLHKLDALGIRGPPLSLIRSYLSNRSQVVEINGCLSQPKLLIKGVPQGSILGPLLFLAYINDLPNFLKLTSAVIYADDTTIFAHKKSLTEVLSLLNSDLDNLVSWCKLNQLYINPAKTHFMLFHSPMRNIDPTPSITLQNVVIHASSAVLFLGVLLDTHLKFHQHINMVSKKIGFGLRVIIKTRRYFPRPIILSLYYSFIHSHLQYCLSSWGNTYLTHLSHLQHLQRQAVRLITFNSHFSEANAIFRTLNVLPLHNLFQQKLTTIIYRVVNNKISIGTLTQSNLLNLNTTRFSENNNLLLPKVKTNYGKFTVYFMGITFWNQLPTNIKTSTSSYSFIKHVKHHLVTTMNSSMA